MQLYKRRKAEPHAVGVGFGEGSSQNTVKKETGFEVRSSRRILDLAHTVAQIEFLRALFDRPEQPLQPSSQVRRLADVRFGLGIGRSQKEHSGGRRHRGEDFRISPRREF
jgi:hypothetical protein